VNKLTRNCQTFGVCFELASHGHISTASCFGTVLIAKFKTFRRFTHFKTGIESHVSLSV